MLCDEPYAMDLGSHSYQFNNAVKCMNLSSVAG
jgi:hypothetical protein